MVSVVKVVEIPQRAQEPVGQMVGLTAGLIEPGLIGKTAKPCQEKVHCGILGISDHAARELIGAQAPPCGAEDIVLVQMINGVRLICAKQLINETVVLAMCISQIFQMILMDADDAAVQVQMGNQQWNMLLRDLHSAQEHPLHGGRVLRAGGVEEGAGDPAIQWISLAGIDLPFPFSFHRPTDRKYCCSFCAKRKIPIMQPTDS